MNKRKNKAEKQAAVRLIQILTLCTSHINASLRIGGQLLILLFHYALWNGEQILLIFIYLLAVYLTTLFSNSDCTASSLKDDR
jgi:hypothetical protein